MRTPLKSHSSEVGYANLIPARMSYNISIVRNNLKDRAGYVSISQMYREVSDTSHNASACGN
jgi:hypothetical protein